jgi:hypothetical protein
VARALETDQIAVANPLPPNSMSDENPDVDKARSRRQPPVPVTFAVFLASVVGFMLVVTGLFALLRHLGGR